MADGHLFPPGIGEGARPSGQLQSGFEILCGLDRRQRCAVVLVDDGSRWVRGRLDQWSA